MKASYSKFVEHKINQYLLARRLARRGLEVKAQTQKPSLWNKVAQRLGQVNTQPVP